MQRRSFVSIAAFVLTHLGCILFLETRVLAANGDAFSGKKLYQTYCIPCHGLSGKGDGITADILLTKPRDLTDDGFMSSRTDQQLFAAIAERSSPHGKLSMPVWQGALMAQQIQALVAYVQTLHRQPPLQGVPARGAALFTLYCWTCHGPTGKGNGEFAVLYEAQVRDLTDRHSMSGRTDTELYNTISLGGAAVGRSAAMPAWGHVLTPQEMWDLVAYLRHISSQP